MAAISGIILAAVLAVNFSLNDVNASAQQTTPFPSREKVISVTGEATTSVEPDLLIIQFGMETQEKTAKQALESNSEAMNNVIDAIKTIGVTEDELSTSNLSIFPVYDSYQDKLTGRYTQELIGYRVTNSIKVETKNLNLAADIIDNAVAAGANRVDSVYFTLSPQKQIEIRDSLLETAILNAKKKAENALVPLNHKIIGVKAISLSEFGVPPPIPVYRTGLEVMEAAPLKAPTPVFTSDQQVTTTANVIFLIGSD